MRDSKAIAMVNSTLYTVKLEHLDEIFLQYPDPQAQIMRKAIKKNQNHKKKIESLEKKYPVYG